MVASYPLLLNYTFIEALAASRGHISMHDAFNQPAVPRQLLTWNHVKCYAQSINVNDMMTGIPFMDTFSQRLLCS